MFGKSKYTIMQCNLYNIIFLQFYTRTIYFKRVHLELMPKRTELLLKMLKQLENFRHDYTFYSRYRFKFYKFTAFFGLGYKKKLYSKLGSQDKFYFFVGDRHWSLLQVPSGSYIFNVKKRNLIFFSASKAAVFKLVSIIKSFKKLAVHFKTKGFFLTRINRRWLLVRRLKLRGFKPKMSTKQKFI